MHVLVMNMPAAITHPIMSHNREAKHRASSSLKPILQLPLNLPVSIPPSQGLNRDMPREKSCAEGTPAAACAIQTYHVTTRGKSVLP